MDDEVDKEGNWVSNSFTLLEIVTHAVFIFQHRQLFLTHSPRKWAENQFLKLF